MKSLMITALATSFAVGSIMPMTAPVAEAKTKVNVDVYLGVPYYRYRPGPDYVYRRGHGWYLPPRYNRYRISCGQAKWEVRTRGFRNVATIECNGPVYTFRATRGGHRTIVYVNARSGAVWRA